MCGDQMALYNEVLPEFHKYHAELLGISVDGVWCHTAFAAARKLRFPLLSDFEPKGAVARTYGAYRAKDGTSERALFVIDGEGTIRWSYCSPVGVAANAGESAYWTMHDALFEHQQDSDDALDDAHLVRYAAAAGAHAGQVKQDLDSERFEEDDRADFMSGVRSGVNGTPTFFVNGARFEGDWTNPNAFAAALEARKGAAAR